MPTSVCTACFGHAIYSCPLIHTQTLDNNNNYRPNAQLPTEITVTALDVQGESDSVDKHASRYTHM